jgi:tetratricopeptide (TPR) repeat protein
MLHRFMSPTRVAAALLAALLASPWALHAAPADDLKEAQRLYGQGKVQPAMEKVDGFLKAQPKDAQGRFLKGLLLTEQKRTAEAIQVFTGLTEDYPELPEPYNNLAVLYASQGNYDKAKSALELAIHTHPSYATAHENLGDIYAQLASRAYDRALQLDKNNATAQTKLSMVKELFVSQRGAGKGAPAPATSRPKPEQEPVSKAKPEMVAKAEAPKTEPARPAPAAAKVEAKPEPAPSKAKPEAAKVEPKAAAPAKAEPAKVEPAKPAAAASADEAAITAALTAWAKAWSAKDVKGYLAAYSPDFEVPGGEKRAAWEKQRTERIERPKSIDVDVKVNSVKVNGNEATVTVRQSYKSDTLKTNSTKVMKLVKSGDKWLIKQERAGG